MHRVVTKCLDHRGRWIVEVGPWLVSYSDAESWAEQLQHLGYHVNIDTMSGGISGGSEDLDFMSALSSMA